MPKLPIKIMISVLQTRELHKIGHREEEVNYTDFFVYKHSDLNSIENKVNNHKYRSLDEFLADTQLIYHNTHLIYGGNTILHIIMVYEPGELTLA